MSSKKGSRKETDSALFTLAGGTFRPELVGGDPSLMYIDKTRRRYGLEKKERDFPDGIVVDDSRDDYR
ncbi:MAG: hypothetical protein AABX66_01975 [Nanoarchaeota archaeon]